MFISCRNTLTETARVTFDQISGCPVVQSGWHMRLALTPIHVVHFRVFRSLCQWKVIVSPGYCLLRSSVVIETALSPRFQDDSTASRKRACRGAVDVSIQSLGLSATLQVVERRGDPQGRPLSPPGQEQPKGCSCSTSRGVW